MSQIAFETPSRPKPCTSPARRSVADLLGRQPELVGRPPPPGRRPRARGRAMYGDLRSTKFAIAQQRGVELLAGQHDGERRLGVDHRIPGPDRVQAGEDHLGLVRTISRASAGSNCVPRAPRASAFAAVDAADAVGDLDELGELRDPRRDRTLLALQLARPARARPTARTRRRAPSSTCCGSPSCSPSVRAIAA